MEQINWIKDLAEAEQRMEETGVVEMGVDFDTERALVQESIQFLLRIKMELVDSITSFNELKSSALGLIKIYGIAKTHADFMIFRNGFKMIFAFKEPGVILIKINFVGANYFSNTSGNNSINDTSHRTEEHNLVAKWGPFHEIQWTYQGKPFRVTNLVRHFLTLFIKESAK